MISHKYEQKGAKSVPDFISLTLILVIQHFSSQFDDFFTHLAVYSVGFLGRGQDFFESLLTGQIFVSVVLSSLAHLVKVPTQDDIVAEITDLVMDVAVWLRMLMFYR